MKKERCLAFLVAVCLTVSGLILPAYAAEQNSGDIVGYFPPTDIKTYIDNCLIPSYCVGDKMVINFEELANYGFDVTYDINAKKLTAYRNFAKPFTPSNAAPAGADSGLIPYEYTDIKTYIGSQEIPCILIKGNVYIYIDDLDYYGTLIWDAETLSLKLEFSDMSDKTPTKFELKGAELNNLSDNGINYDLTGFTVNFSGEHYFIDPDDFTEITLKDKGTTVKNIAITYAPSRLSVSGGVTSAVFTLAEKITQTGVYNISGKYKGIPFTTNNVVIETYPAENKPANAASLKEVLIGTEKLSSTDSSVLSENITFVFDGIQGTFSAANLSNLKLTANRQPIGISIVQNSVKREVKYSEETRKFSTYYHVRAEYDALAYGTYVLSGKYMTNVFTSDKVIVKTLSGKVASSVVFSANSDGILTQEAVLEQLDANALSVSSDIVANFDSNVKSIGKWAFANCSGLAAINFNAEISSIDVLPFLDCTKLELLHIDGKNKDFIVSDNVLFNKDMTILYLCPAKRTGSYTIPDNVKVLYPNSFYNCSKLTEITIPEGVTQIAGHAFSECNKVKSITIPNSVRTIGYGAFANCTGLKTITFKGINPPVISENVFPEIQKVYVPGVSLAKYKKALENYISGAQITAYN